MKRWTVENWISFFTLITAIIVLFYTGCLFNQTKIQVDQAIRANDSTAKQIEYARHRDSIKDKNEEQEWLNKQELTAAQISSLQAAAENSKFQNEISKDYFDAAIAESKKAYAIADSSLKIQASSITNQINTFKKTQDQFFMLNKAHLEYDIDSVTFPPGDTTVVISYTIRNLNPNMARILGHSFTLCFLNENCDFQNEDSIAVNIDKYINANRPIKMSAFNYFQDTSIIAKKIIFDIKTKEQPFYVFGIVKYVDYIIDKNRIYRFRIKCFIPFEGGISTEYQANFNIDENEYYPDDNPNLKNKRKRRN